MGCREDVLQWILITYRDMIKPFILTDFMSTATVQDTFAMIKPADS